CPDNNRQITLHRLLRQFTTGQQSLQQNFIRAAIKSCRNNCFRAPLFFVASWSKQGAGTDRCIEILDRNERSQIETDNDRSIVKSETLNQPSYRSNQIHCRGSDFALQFNVEDSALIAAK